MLTGPELAHLLQVNERLVRRWRTEEDLPHIDISRGGKQCKARYHWPTVMRWLRRRLKRINPKDEVAAVMRRIHE